MRRKDREVTDYNEILEIMKKCEVCRLAIHGEKYPYIVPMNFGVSMLNGRFKLYFHCATVGTKLDLIRRDPNVSFEMDCSHRLILSETACNSTMEYESVCGYGSIQIVDEADRADGLAILMKQYQPKKKHEFDYNELKAVEVLELTVEEIYGKRLKVPTAAPKEDEKGLASLSCAMRYGAEGRIEEWVHKFLCRDGKNLALASGLLHQQRYFLGPVRMSMDLFDIPEGAPDYLTTDDDIKWFFQVSDSMAESLKNGWDMPPLIVNYDNGRFISTDGRHRFEALRKMNAKEVEAIIWTSSKRDYDDLYTYDGIKPML